MIHLYLCKRRKIKLRGCKGFDWVGFTIMQDDGQRGIVKTLECLIANDNVAFDYAVAA